MRAVGPHTAAASDHRVLRKQVGEKNICEAYRGVRLACVCACMRESACSSDAVHAMGEYKG